MATAYVDAAVNDELALILHLWFHDDILAQRLDAPQAVPGDHPVKKITKLLPALTVLLVLGAPGATEAQTSLSSPQAWYDFSWSPDEWQTPAFGTAPWAGDNYTFGGSFVSMLGSRGNGPGPQPPPPPSPPKTGPSDGNDQGQGEGEGQVGDDPPGENPRTVPEPATIFLIAFGLVGLGVAAVHRPGAA